MTRDNDLPGHLPLPPGAGRIATLWPGCALAALLATAATFVSASYGGPAFLYTLLLGAMFHHLSEEPRSRPGIEFAARTLLRLGVGLLGVRITISQIASLGWVTAAVVVTGVVTTIGLGVLLSRRFGMTRAQGVLAGGAVAICGASAALALSAVLPRDRHGDPSTAVVVIAVTVLSTVAMVGYPLIASALQLPPALAGLFLGGTIHDVAQVVGAGYMLGQQTGDIATVVKLFRVAMLTVVVAVVSLTFRHSRTTAGPEAGSATAPLVPWFLGLFLALVLVNSAGWLPASIQGALGEASRLCLLTAIAALGVKTSVARLAGTGWRPVVLIVVCTAWLGLLVLGAVLLMR